MKLTCMLSLHDFCSSGELLSHVLNVGSKWSVHSGSEHLKAQIFWFADTFGTNPYAGSYSGLYLPQVTHGMHD